MGLNKIKLEKNAEKIFVKFGVVKIPDICFHFPPLVDI
jgi:hypothetical protein